MLDKGNKYMMTVDVESFEINEKALRPFIRQRTEHLEIMIQIFWGLNSKAMKNEISIIPISNF